MSKRKNKPPVKKSTQELRAGFLKANNELHLINVSTPILRVVERLVSDPSFRVDVIRRMTSR